MTVNYGSKRVVVGAHYGMRDWLSQRVTGALMALFTIVLLAQVIFSKGPIGYDKWAGMFSRQWMKVLTFTVIVSLLIHAWVEGVPDAGFSDTRVQTVLRLGEASQIVRLPRYEAFTQVALALHAQGVRFVNIAGNDEILVTAIGPAARSPDLSPARIASRAALPTDPSRVRLALRVPVRSLHEVLTRLQTEGITIEHLYDY